VLLALLLSTLPALALPTADGAPPRALETFSGSLYPGEITSPPLSWELYRDVDEFMFHYAITGGSEPDDLVYVWIEETGLRWDSLMGEGWSYCDCFLPAGSYSITIEADAAASSPLTYSIGFHLVPQPPVDFNGFILANSNVFPNDYGSFGAFFPSAASHQVVLGATSGDYEFFMDGESKAVVTGTTELSIDFTLGFHVFQVLAGEGDVRWSVQILGPPKLEVRILNTCPVLNPDSGESTCVIGAEATASDGGNPTVSYLWSGGSFNSTSSQWVEWTPPPGVADFTLTVEASAPGYLSDTDMLKAQVVPEFPSSAFPLIIAVALAVVLLTRRPRR